jgi:hypothetical protein
MNINTEGQEGGEQERQEDDNSIPSQYRGLPRDVVEQLWQPPQFIDPEINKKEQERRKKALEQISQQEAQDISTETQDLDSQMAELPPERLALVTQAQQESAQRIADHFNGVSRLDETLTPHEALVLGKAEDIYKRAKAERPHEPVAFQFTEKDNAVYSNLLKKLALEKVREQAGVKDEEKLADLQKEMGIDLKPEEEKKNNPMLPKEGTLENNKAENAEAISRLKPLMENYAQRSRNPDVQRAYFDELVKKNDKKIIVETLANMKQESLRKAQYKSNPQYETAWNLATQDTSLNHRIESDWIYRGNFSSAEKKTVTRGSLNIEITDDVVRELDDLIKKGIIDANYKFGDPHARSAADERHDAITIYFLKEPSEEALKVISDLAKKHYRGNDLIGKKVSEGFYMSEIGSISDTQASRLLEELHSVDIDIEKAIRAVITSRDNKGEPRVAMSEAAFYSVKFALNAYGYDIRFDMVKGIVLESINK